MGTSQLSKCGWLGGALLAAVAALVPATVARAQQSPQATIEAAMAAGSLQINLTDYLADKLMLANQAEIELSKVAEQRSSNEKVKTFAQSLIADHKQFNDKLVQVAPEASQRFAAQPPRRRLIPQVRTAAREDASHEVLTALCKVNHKAAKIHLEKSLEMLKQYQGQDFDMAYLGLQIAQHSWLLSELQALKGVGTSEFQQALAGAQQKVEQHLKDAQMLAKQLEDDRRVRSS